MKIVLVKSQFDFKKFSVQISKRNTNLKPYQVINYLRKFTGMDWMIRDEVHDKFYAETKLVGSRKIRKKWKGQVIEIPEPEEE